jgi:molybdate transport repressor ModE-like protein
VAEEGSVAAAARRLGYSQPGVSQQLATLERLLESRLVERRPGVREATLTEAGRSC